MRAPSFPSLAAGLLWIAMGCGGGGGSSGSLDCAWLDGENCWKTTASQAASCLPPESESGVLSADLRTCTYPGGQVVTFDPPLVLPLPDEALFKFTVTNGGATCLRLDEGSSGFALTVGGETFRESSSGFGLSVTCPDGQSFANDNALELLSCPSDGGLFPGLPGWAWSDSDSAISFALLNVSSDTSSSLPVFDCSRAVSSTAALTTTDARRTRTRVPAAGRP